MKTMYYYYCYMIDIGTASNKDYLLLVIAMPLATGYIIYYDGTRMALALG
jgi:hypothetical protein